MKIKTRKSAQIGVRLDKDTREKLQLAANREGRTLSDMARRLIVAGLVKRVA